MNATSRRKSRSCPSAEFTITPSTVTPTEINDAPSSTPITFTFNYNGEARTPTLSGRIPNISGLSHSVTTTAFTFRKNPDTIEAMLNGGNTQVLTFTLPATSTYPAATATLTFTNCDTSDFRDI